MAADSGRFNLPMALPFIMLGVLFRGHRDFQMFDIVNAADQMAGRARPPSLASNILSLDAAKQHREHDEGQRHRRVIDQNCRHFEARSTRGLVDVVGDRA